MRDSVKHGKSGNERKLQQVLESMLAELCLPAHSNKEADEDCFHMVEELRGLVNEMIQVYAVAKAWEHAGEQRAYEALIHVGPNGIRKSSNKEWRRTDAEAEAPRPHPKKACLDRFCALCEFWGLNVYASIINCATIMLEFTTMFPYRKCRI